MVENPSITTKFAIAQTVAAGSVTVAYPFDTVRRRLMMMSGEGEKMYKGRFTYDVCNTYGFFDNSLCFFMTVTLTPACFWGTPKL